MTRSLHLSFAFVALVTFGFASCGDDALEPKDASVADDDGGRPGRGGSRGVGGARAESNIVPLDDDTAGQACERDGDCGAGRCLAMLPGPFGSGSIPAPGGYCTGECANNRDCGGGGVCAGAFGGLAGGIGAVRGRCLATCRESSDCRAGYRCVNGLGLPLSESDAALGPTTHSCPRPRWSACGCAFRSRNSCE